MSTSLRLYCFPHAGTSASAFRGWADAAPDGLHIHGVDAPGRGRRGRETPVGSYPELVAALTDHVVADLRAAPGLRWATFGHSFGTVVSLSVGAAVGRATGRWPERAFLSAGLPPCEHVRTGPGELDEDALLARVRADGGTRPELLESAAMRAIVVRLMREDITLRGEFPDESGLCVDYPFTTIAARDDDRVPPERMARWDEHTAAGCARLELAGGHFAALADPARLLALVEEHLRATPAVTAR